MEIKFWAITTFRGMLACIDQEGYIWLYDGEWKKLKGPIIASTVESSQSTPESP